MPASFAELEAFETRFAAEADPFVTLRESESVRAALNALCDDFAAATPDERGGMHRRLEQLPSVKLALFDHLTWCTERVRGRGLGANERSAALRRGLIAAVLEAGAFDHRETLTALGTLYVAAHLRGLSPSEAFDDAAKLGDGSNDAKLEAQARFVGGFTRSAYFASDSVQSELATPPTSGPAAPHSTRRHEKKQPR